MGRHNKKGLDYFPLDIDFFEDEKIQFINARFGIKGEAIIIRILAKIYRNGYYLKFGEDERLLFAKGVGDISLHSCVNDVVNESVKRGLFDKDIFDKFETLTSKGIQRRFLQAVERRKTIEWIQDFSLIDINDYINEINVNINNINEINSTQSRVEKSRVEKSLTKSTGERSQIFYAQVAEFKKNYPREMLRNFYDYWTEPNKSGSKMRFELQQTWDLKRRLNTWASRENMPNNQSLKSKKSTLKQVDLSKI